VPINQITLSLFEYLRQKTRQLRRHWLGANEVIYQRLTSLPRASVFWSAAPMVDLLDGYICSVAVLPVAGCGCTIDRSAADVLAPAAHFVCCRRRRRRPPLHQSRWWSAAPMTSLAGNPCPWQQVVGIIYFPESTKQSDVDCRSNFGLSEHRHRRHEPAVAMRPSIDVALTTQTLQRSLILELVIEPQRL